MFVHIARICLQSSRIAMFLPFFTLWRGKISYVRLHESELESKCIFRWFYSRIVCVLHNLLEWKGGLGSPLNYPLSCPVDTFFVLAVFQAWRDCLLSFTLAFQHFFDLIFLGWSSLKRCWTVKVKLVNLIRSIKNERTERLSLSQPP